MLEGKKIFVILAITLSAWLFFFRDNPEKTSPSQEPNEPALAAEENHREPNRPSTTKVQTSAEIKEGQPKTPQNPIMKEETGEPRPSLETKKGTFPFAAPMKYVPYKMISGFAVAYGDVLLGKPVDMSKVPKGVGFTKTPPSGLWPEGIVPYFIDKDHPKAKEILAAIDIFHQKTQLEFVPFRNGDPDALVFKPHEDPKFCASYLGMIGGHQPIFLGNDCQLTSILHEIMHALGFIHEQSRSDRDNFVEILWQNIEEDKHSQFAMVPQNIFDRYRSESFDFDPTSIMMYSPNAFAKTPGLITIKPRGNFKIMPSSNGLSSRDIDRVNRVYF